MHPATDQNVALRLVALADRLYDRGSRSSVSGEPLRRCSPRRCCDGGYRKKYLRAISRLVALSRYEVPAG